MDYANPTEIWWPHPSAFDDLSVDFTDLEDGGSEIHLSAPDGTECADWLAYFQETDERKAAFERAFMNALIDQIKLRENGKNEELPDEQNPGRSGGEENQPRSVEEHESRGDSQERS